MSLSDQLTEAAEQTGISANDLARTAGVFKSMVFMFVAGKDVVLKTADRLAAQFGWVLTPEAESPKKRGK